MSFYNEYLRFKNLDFDKLCKQFSELDIRRALSKVTLTFQDFLALLSPQAEAFLEEMAVKAHHITIQNFGRTILLYTPLYLANYCTNQCVYCGFNTKNKIPRKQLTLAEVEEEAKAIAATGMKHLVILTGDAKKISSVEYIASCIKVLKKFFSSISLEIYALEEAEYAYLIESGADALTIYQETYNETLYDELHPRGPKKDYLYRLDAPERACKANIRSVNIGALLGLDDWRKDAFFTALHAHYLQNNYPQVEVSISLPRMRPHEGAFQPRSIVSEKNLVQFMLAFRLFMPRAGITMSTRESSQFRDNIVKLGVTKMSAASITTVGGHADKESNDTGQFEISDERNVPQMCKALTKQGYQPVFKDWHVGIAEEG